VRWQLDIPTYYINFTKYLELSPFLRRTIHFPPYLKRKENKFIKISCYLFSRDQKKILWTRNTDSKFKFIFKDTYWSHPPTWVWSPSWRGGSRSVSWGPPAAPGGCRSTRTVHSSRIWTRIEFKSLISRDRIYLKHKIWDAERFPIRDPRTEHRAQAELDKYWNIRELNVVLYLSAECRQTRGKWGGGSKRSLLLAIIFQFNAPCPSSDPYDPSFMKYSTEDRKKSALGL
jgi:hypothetical protein